MYRCLQVKETDNADHSRVSRHVARGEGGSIFFAFINDYIKILLVT